MQSRKSLFVLAAFVVSVGCGYEPDATAAAGALGCGHERTPVIFDTDMDFDDAAALALLCAEHRRGNIELLAVTVANDGAGVPGSAIRHARCVLAACGLPSVPVADGSSVGEHAAAPELQGAVELVLEGAFASCTETRDPSTIGAPDLLASALRHARDPVVVLATGPLTNLAAALSGPRGRGHALVEHIDRVVAMGGAFDVPGNLLGSGTETFDGTQEFNVWADPAAYVQVLAALPAGMLTLVPLDATQFVPVTTAFVARLEADRGTGSADVVASIAEQPIIQFGISIHAFYWWDPLAALVATGHPGIVDFARERITVVDDDSAASGRTRVSRRGRLAEVGIGADGSAFEVAFLDGLNERD